MGLLADTFFGAEDNGFAVDDVTVPDGQHHHVVVVGFTKGDQGAEPGQDLPGAEDGLERLFVSGEQGIQARRCGLCRRISGSGQFKDPLIHEFLDVAQHIMARKGGLIQQLGHRGLLRGDPQDQPSDIVQFPGGRCVSVGEHPAVRGPDGLDEIAVLVGLGQHGEGGLAHVHPDPGAIVLHRCLGEIETAMVQQEQLAQDLQDAVGQDGLNVGQGEESQLGQDVAYRQSGFPLDALDLVDLGVIDAALVLQAAQELLIAQGRLGIQQLPRFEGQGDDPVRFGDGQNPVGAHLGEEGHGIGRMVFAKIPFKKHARSPDLAVGQSVLCFGRGVPWRTPETPYAIYRPNRL